MDTLIFLVSAAVLVTLGYGVFWTVGAMRQVGLRRFAGALRALVWSVIRALLKLLAPLPNINGKKGKAYRWVDAWDDVRIANEWQRLSDTNSKVGNDAEF